MDRTLIIQFDNFDHIICGDWNMVLDPLKDTLNYLHLNNPKTREVVLELIATHELLDIWRENNPNERRFTWRQPNPLKQARLDYFLTSSSIAEFTKTLR